VTEFEVVLLKFDLPSGSTRSYFLGLTPVREVLVISPYNDRLIWRSGTKEVRPMTEGMDDGEEFPIVHFVVHFCGCQSF